jgi:cytochrome P450
MIIERRKRPQDDLLTRLIEAGREQERLTEPDLLATCGLLFVAGHETAVNLIGNGMLALLNSPGEVQRLRGDVGLLPSAVEELLRYDSPVQRVGRMSNSAVEIGGKTIRKGAVVLAMLGAANLACAAGFAGCHLVHDQIGLQSFGIDPVKVIRTEILIGASVLL